MAMKNRHGKGKPLPLALRPQTRATKNWLKALHLTSSRRVDPWEKFGLDGLREEKAIRHRYNAFNGTWSSEVIIFLFQILAFGS